MAGVRYLEQAPILVAEATAVRDGLKSALEAGYRHIEVEGDNQVVLNAKTRTNNAPLANSNNH